MRHFRPIRTLALGLAATSMIAVGFAAPAGSATPASCTKATFKTNLAKKTSTSQVSGCTKGPATAVTLGAKFQKYERQGDHLVEEGREERAVQDHRKAGQKPNKCKLETVKGKKVQDALIVSTAKI